MPRLPITIRPVQWPSTLVRGLRIAPIIRRVIGAGVHPQLGVHAGDPDVELGQHLVGLVEAAVVEDVDLDPLEQREAATPARCSLIASTTPSCRVSRATLSPLATVSRGEWSVSTR